MPTAPPRPCAGPHCGRLTRTGTLCRRCRPHAAQRGYDATWRRFSRDWLQRYPLCGMRADGRLHADDSRCAAQGLRVRADCTDHIVSMRNGGARLDPMNCQSLCRPCNARKAILLEGAFARSEAR